MREDRQGKTDWTMDLPKISYAVEDDDEDDDDAISHHDKTVDDDDEDDEENDIDDSNGKKIGQKVVGDEDGESE